MVLKLDLDDPHTEQKIMTLGGTEFNITEMPISVFLFLNERSAERRVDGKFLMGSDYYDATLMWLQAIKGSDNITTKWLDENLSGNRLQQFVLTVINPLMNPAPLEFVDPAAGPVGGKSKSPRR
jgi:hypothetical protein